MVVAKCKIQGAEPAEVIVEKKSHRFGMNIVAKTKKF